MLSAHDSQISNLWLFLDPINFKQDDLQGNFRDWYHIPYASHIQIELHKTLNCSGKPSCYSMLFVANGIPLKFRDLNSMQTTENLNLKTPYELDKSIQMREKRLKMGLYEYTEMKEYLKSISFKCLGYGSHIEQ